MSWIDCVKDAPWALFQFIIKDAMELLLNFAFLVITGVFAYLFRKDKLGLQAFRAFDFKDNTLNYLHRPSVISGNNNIIISTIYGVSW
jgi:hypothetical protein